MFIINDNFKCQIINKMRNKENLMQGVSGPVLIKRHWILKVPIRSQKLNLLILKKRHIVLLTTPLNKVACR